MEVKCAFICYFLVLASTLWLPGEAQLCPTTTPCDVNFDVIASFQQYNLDDNVKTCIRCLFNGMVLGDTTWNIEDPPISLTDGPDPLGTSNNGVLEICSTNPILSRTNDNGPRFICASATAGESFTLFMTIRALNPPSITPVDEPLIIDEGTAQMLSCLHPDSQPVTLEQWTGPDGSVLSNQSTLILTNPTRADTGLYTCTITDDRSNTRSSSRAIVVRSESPLPPINPLLICDSSNLLFTWDPPPTELTTAVADNWNIEIEEFGEDDTLMNVTISAQPTMFVFTDLMCTPLTVYCARVAGIFIDATNMNMEEIGEFSDYVCTEPLVPTTKPTTAPTTASSPTITVNGDELSNGLLTVEPGADVVLTCSSTSTGSPSWSRQSLDLPPQAVVNGGVLTLPMVTEQDSGVYICDSGGVSDTVALIVEKPGVDGRVIGIAVSISVVVLLVIVALLVLLSVLLRKKCNAMPPAAEPSVPVYDYVNCSPEYEDPDKCKTQPYEMKENAAYGPVCQVQGLEMEENAAYGPLGH